MSQRVKVIFREFGRSGARYVGLTGVLVSLSRSTGQAEVSFDGGETVTIDACCLQHLD